VYKLKLENSILCFFCEEKVKCTIGRKKQWRSLNELHGHCSYEHKKLNFKDYLMNLADQIIKGELK